MQKLKTCVYIGRFQPVHKGHLKCILKGLEHTDKIIIVVGSTNESRTLRNPLTYKERVYLLYGSLLELGVDMSRVEIVGLADTGNLDTWVDNLKELIDRHMLKDSELYNVDTGEYDLRQWFKGYNINYIKVSRSDGISATKVREAIVSGDTRILKCWISNYTYGKLGMLHKILRCVYN